MIKTIYLIVTVLALASCNSGKYYFNQRIGHPAVLIGEEKAELDNAPGPVEAKEQAPVFAHAGNSTLYTGKHDAPLVVFHSPRPDSVRKRVIEDKNGNLKVVEEREETTANAQTAFWTSAGAIMVTAFAIVLASGLSLGQALLIIMGIFILMLMVITSAITEKTVPYT